VWSSSRTVVGLLTPATLVGCAEAPCYVFVPSQCICALIGPVCETLPKSVQQV
jgi:hypothetical protein